MEGKHWCNVELVKEKAELFKDYLRHHNIYFEPSEAFNLIHFECFVTEEEHYFVNEFLAKL